MLKLAKDRPSWTVQSQPGSATGPFHWRNRRLSARELCRIQTFPDDYRISGSLSQVQKQLGNAVPSLVAEILAMEIRRQLLDAPLRRKTPRLAVEKRDDLPPPETVKRVPKEYLHLVGNHPEHPGTGKGHQVKGTWG